jgi:hypothetical protein
VLDSLPQFYEPIGYLTTPYQPQKVLLVECLPVSMRSYSLFISYLTTLLLASRLCSVDNKTIIEYGNAELRSESEVLRENLR